MSTTNNQDIHSEILEREGWGGGRPQCSVFLPSAFFQQSLTDSYLAARRARDFKSTQVSEVLLFIPFTENDDEVMLNVLRCQFTDLGQAVTNAEAWFNIALRCRKPEGSLGRTAQDGHLDSHTAPELCVLQENV